MVEYVCMVCIKRSTCHSVLYKNVFALIQIDWAKHKYNIYSFRTSTTFKKKDI